MMPTPQPPSSVRTTVRYYLWTEEGAQRLSNRLHAELVSRKTALRTLANSRQRIVEAYVSQLGKRPLLVKTRGVYYRFDAEGYLDMGSAAEAVAIAVDRAQEGLAGQNVVDLGPRLRDRQWRREHRWKPGREVLQRITEDVTGQTRIGRFKE